MKGRRGARLSKFPFLPRLPLLSPSVNREAVINSHLLWRWYCPLVRALLSFQASSQKALFNSPCGARISDRSFSYVIGPSLLLFVSALSFSFVLFGAENAARAPFGHARITCAMFVCPSYMRLHVPAAVEGHLHIPYVSASLNPHLASKFMVFLCVLLFCSVLFTLSISPLSPRYPLLPLYISIMSACTLSSPRQGSPSGTDAFKHVCLNSCQGLVGKTKFPCSYVSPWDALLISMSNRPRWRECHPYPGRERP